MNEQLLRIISTPALADYRLHTFRGSEGFSQLFHYDLELEANSEASHDPDELADKLLGKPVAFGLRLSSGAFRPFHGIATRLWLAEVERRVRLELAPKLWLLGLSSDCRTFAGKDVETITRMVLTDAGFSPTEFRIELQGRCPVREHCVAFRESHLNFLIRLWEEEGLTYSFEVVGEGQGHTLVVTDDPARLGGSGMLSLPRRAPSSAEAWEKSDAIHSWRQSRELRPASYSLTARDWRNPGADLSATVKAPKGPPVAGTMFDLGEYTTAPDGKRQAALRIGEESLSRRFGAGTGNARALAPGVCFQLTQPEPRAGILSRVASAAGLAGDHAQCHRVTSVRHEATEGDDDARGSYHNSFTAAPDGVTIRPTRVTPRPVVHGVFPAVVVGNDGRPEPGDGPDVHLDSWGRARIRLHWDRSDAANEPLYARVSQPWAGDGFGAWFPPRIGQEVLVAWEEGDPDRPLVIGSVYHAAEALPFGAASLETACGLRSHSLRDHARGHGSELSIDDKLGEEKFCLVAQKDLHTHVKNDARAVVDGSQSGFVKQDSTERIGRHRRTWISGDRTERVGQDSSLEVVGALLEKIGGALGIDASGSVTIKSGAGLVIQAGAQITLVVGGNHVTIGPDGVRINGTLVQLNCGGGGPATAEAVTVAELELREHPQPVHRR
jgi:type VI secretion system secreted protein VgrG